jgi:hypothetical protein
LGLGCRTLIGDGEQNQPSSPSDRGHGSSLTIYLDCDFLLCYRSVPGALLGLAMRHGLPTGTVVVAFVDFLITFVTLILR